MKREFQLILKHTTDKILAIFMIIILMPLWLLIMIAIKLDDGGPIFFIQDRLGKDGTIFKIYKFRTMLVDADKFLDEHGHVVNKNRITRVGKFLRKLSLDELPQLINIIKGDMSIIGPRPALPG